MEISIENTPGQIEILQAILNSTSDNLVMMDSHCKVKAHNKAIQSTLFSYFGKHLAIGEDYRTYVIDPLKDTFQQAFNTALGGEKIDVEIETIHEDIKIWFRYQLWRVLDNKDQLIGVIMTATNIDEKKRAQLALEEEAQRLAAVIDNSPESIIILDNQTRVVKFNEVARLGSMEVTGKTITEGSDFWSYVHPQLAESLKDSLHQISQGNIVHKEDFLQLENGESFWFDSKVFPVKVKDKVIGTCIVTGRIDERKKTEQKIQQFVHELNLLNAINDIILKTDNEFELCNEVLKCIVEVGNYKLAWFGFSPKEDDSDQEIQKRYGYGCLDYYEEIKISLNNEAHLKGPAAICLSTRQVVVNNEVSKAANFAPWAHIAEKYGIKASVAVPVNIDTANCVALNIYSENPLAFDEAEVTLLSRIAKNISLALWQLNMEREKQNAMYSLNERIKELRTIYAVNNILIEEDTFEKKLEKIVAILPSGWQYPEYCAAKIIFNKQTFTSKQYPATGFSQSTEFTTVDGKLGKIEIIYDAEIPHEPKSLFLKEEFELLKSLADDISQAYNRLLLDEELKKTQQNLLTVFNNSETGFLLLDSNFDIISINDPFKNVYAEIIGHEMNVGDNFMLFLKRDKRDTALTKMNESIELRKPVTYESAHAHGNETRHFQINVVPVFDQKGILYGICQAVQDITQRKAQEVLLEQQRVDIQNALTMNTRIIETSDQFFYIAAVTDQHLHQFEIDFMSPQVQQILGYSADNRDQLKRGWMEFIHPSDRKRYQGALNKLFTTRNPNRISYRIIIAGTGEIKWVEDYMRPFTDADNKLIEIYGSVRDINDQMVILTELENMQRRSNEHQSKLLSSQLNPHFIYNTLNAFQYSILQGKTEESINHIADFSKLMRLVMENSLDKFISIREEREFLNQYIKLSSFRIQGGLDYEIFIDENIDEDEVLIPPMLLQPYVENAIIHGFSEAQDHWKLVVKISREGDRICCSIRDYGIGRMKAMENRAVQGSHKSLAMNINKQRIELLNSFTNGHFEVTIIDHFNSENISTGTEVVLTFTELKDDF